MENETSEVILPRRRFLYFPLFFSLAGSALALYASILTFKLTVSGITEPGICSFNDWISCDAVLSTNSAKMFNAPVAWWGFLYYLWASFTILFAIINVKKIFGKACAEAVLFISFFSVLFTFFKIYQLISLRLLCPVCVGMYICNFSIFLFLMKLLKITFKQIISFEINYFKCIFKKKSSEENSIHPLRFGVIFVWLFAMGYLGVKYYENTLIEPALSTVKEILNEHFKQKPVKINTSNAPVTGNPEAKVQIVEFSDFECPGCKLLSSNLKGILPEYKNDACVLFMNYPLDQSVNVNVKKEIHKNAGLAALAGICANEQGDFWNYHNELFENQTKINKEFLIELAEHQGLDKSKFNVCMESDSSKQKLISDIKAAQDINVTGTPSLFINGRKVKYWNSPTIIKSVIEEEIRMNK